MTSGLRNASAVPSLCIRASSLLMLRETSVAMTSFKSTWVTPDAGAAGVGSTASAAMAPSAKLALIRPPNTVRRTCSAIAFAFCPRAPSEGRYSATVEAANSLLGGRCNKRRPWHDIEIGQQGREQPQRGQVGGEGIDEFDAGAVGNPTECRRADTGEPKRKAEEET